MRHQPLTHPARLALSFLLSLLSSGFVAQAQNSRLTAVNYPTGYGLSTGSVPVSSGGRLFYASQIPGSGTELVVLNSALSNPAVIDINAGANSSNPIQITPVGDKVIFTADDGFAGRELYTSDGATSQRLTDYVAGSGSSFSYSDYNLTFGSWALISQNYGNALVVTDGTASGTRRITRSNAYLYAFSVAGKALLLVSNFNSPDSLLLYDYATDSQSFLTTMAATQYAIYTNSGAIPINTAVAGNRFVLGFGSQIVYSDGTASGTFVTSASAGETFANASNFTLFDGKVYYSAYTSSAGAELHVLDPVAQTSEIAADVNLHSNGLASSTPEALVVFDDTLFFIADDGSYGAELYKLKGSFFRRITDIGSGTSGISGAGLDTAFGGLLIGRGTYYDQSYLYRRGRLTASPHNVRNLPAVNNLRRSRSVIEVPERNLRLAVLARPGTGSDSLVALLGGPRFRHYIPTQSFRPYGISLSVLSDYAVAGNALYLGSGYTAFVWRVDEPVVAVQAPVVAASRLTFYPNPAHAQNIRYTGEEGLTELALWDGQGRCRLRLDGLASDQELATADLPRGLYILQGRQNGKVFTQKLILD